ncbi:MAG: hypothetical protein ABIO46_05640 [Chitinophagales bacterium]
MDFATIIASIGVTMLLIAFFLNIFHFLDEKSFSYIGLNLVGAGISCYASYLIHFTPFVVLEGTWGAVAMAGLVSKVWKNYKL